MLSWLKLLQMLGDGIKPAMDKLGIIGLGAVVGLVGCGDNRLAQCQAIMQTAAETQSIKLKDDALQPDLDLWLEAAVALETAAAEIEDLKITDKQLTQYQQGFGRVYRENAIATQKMVEARQSRDLQKAKEAQQQVNSAGELEIELVEGINRYCLDSKAALKP